jgi:hypothetical protein
LTIYKGQTSQAGKEWRRAQEYYIDLLQHFSLFINFLHDDHKNTHNKEKKLIRNPSESTSLGFVQHVPPALRGEGKSLHAGV